MHIEVEEIIPTAWMEVSKVHVFYVVTLKVLLEGELKLQSRTKPGVLGSTLCRDK